MICPECKLKFNFVDRIKSMNNKNSKIQCRNCKNYLFFYLYLKIGGSMKDTISSYNNKSS